MEIGLFFGTFNPIHIGHLIIANHLVEYTYIDQVWFVVSPQNPFKTGNNLLNEYQRLELVRLAIEDDIRFKASDIEFTMPRPSYTIHTLLVLEEKYPSHKFNLIIGSDNLKSLNKWKNYEQILQNYKLLVYPRPGGEGHNLLRHRNVKTVNAPLMEISSTYVRRNIKNKKEIRYVVPERVREEIEIANYYGT